jgi:hypothetical protein
MKHIFRLMMTTGICIPILIISTPLFIQNGIPFSVVSKFVIGIGLLFIIEAIFYRQVNQKNTNNTNYTLKPQIATTGGNVPCNSTDNKNKSSGKYNKFLHVESTIPKASTKSKENLMNHYRRNFIVYEFWIPFVLVLFLGILIELILKSNAIDVWLLGVRKEVYAAIATIFGALLGFTITAISIVIVFVNSERLELLKKSKHYRTLYNVFLVTIKYLAFTTIIALISLILDRDTRTHHWITYLNLFGVILSIIGLSRCIWVLENIVKLITKPKEV